MPPSPEEKEYEILEDGNAIVRRLRERYPWEFRHVVPDEVVVLVITNKPRPFSMKKLALITKVNAAHRTVIKAYGHKDVKYLIEIYVSDWTQWGLNRKTWIIAHEIGHIPDPDAKSLVTHSVEDHAWLLDAVGVEWWSKDNLPDLLSGEPYPFRKEFFYHLHKSDEDGEGLSDGRQ